MQRNLQILYGTFSTKQEHHLQCDFSYVNFDISKTAGKENLCDCVLEGRFCYLHVHMYIFHPISESHYTYMYRSTCIFNIQFLNFVIKFQLRVFFHEDNKESYNDSVIRTCSKCIDLQQSFCMFVKILSALTWFMYTHTGLILRTWRGKAIFPWQRAPLWLMRNL